MGQPLHTGRLILTPQSPYYIPDDLPGLIAELQNIGFISTPLSGSLERYLLGENFMQWVTFMGCSPFIQLEPGAPEQPFCHFVVDGPSLRPRLKKGKNTTPPRCSHCRKRLPGWREIFDTWRLQTPGWQANCPHCAQAQDPATYDFRQTASCGRLFLLLENIFPQEAIPAPALLNLLQAASGDQPWHHFYQQD
jgi:hypothetical protein